jgi:hypothetical protein
VYRAGRDTHAFFERIIDALMLRELRGLETAAWDQEGILAAICDDPPLGLKELIARALASAFPEKTGKDHKLALRIDNAFADCAGFYRFTAPAKTGIQAADPGAFTGGAEGRQTLSVRSLSCVFPENLPAGIDFLNLNHAPWFYPWVSPTAKPKADTRSFPEIYAAALEAALDALAPCIEQYLAGGIFPIAEAARNIGNGSLSIQDDEGKPAAPNRTDPLPLDDVLREQARRRGIGVNP